MKKYEEEDLIDGIPYISYGICYLLVVLSLIMFFGSFLLLIYQSMTAREVIIDATCSEFRNILKNIFLIILSISIMFLISIVLGVTKIIREGIPLRNMSIPKEKILTPLFFFFSFFAFSFSLINYMDSKYDKSVPVTCEIKVTDIFKLCPEQYSDTMGYVGFETPAELIQYQLTMVRDEDINKFKIGQIYRLEKHRGYLGIPWFKFIDNIPYIAEKNSDLDMRTRKTRMKYGEGHFSNKYKEVLKSLGIPIVELKPGELIKTESPP